MTTYIVDASGVVQFFRVSTPLSKSKVSEQAVSSAPVRCPFCKILMPLRKLRNHTVVAHGSDTTVAIDLVRMKPNCLVASHAGDATGMRPSVERGEVCNRSAGADTMDCSRGMGHFAREGGRFGSMPSYDDYGEQGLA